MSNGRNTRSWLDQRERAARLKDSRDIYRMSIWVHCIPLYQLSITIEESCYEKFRQTSLIKVSGTSGPAQHVAHVAPDPKTWANRGQPPKSCWERARTSSLEYVKKGNGLVLKLNAKVAYWLGMPFTPLSFKPLHVLILLGSNSTIIFYVDLGTFYAGIISDSTKLEFCRSKVFSPELQDQKPCRNAKKREGKLTPIRKRNFWRGTSQIILIVCWNSSFPWFQLEMKRLSDAAKIDGSY